LEAIEKNARNDYDKGSQKIPAYCPQISFNMTGNQTLSKFRTPLGIDMSQLQSGAHPLFSRSTSSAQQSLEVVERELAKVLNAKLRSAIALPTFGDSATSFGITPANSVLIS